MKKLCKQCRHEFIINPEDREFYRLMDVPEPTRCAVCRMIRRLSFRKERFLYNRVCDLTGKQIVSAYPKNAPLNRKSPFFPVYDIDAWWSDRWDPMAYGRPFDFTKPFFEQFFQLQSQVPRMALIQQKPMENSAYCNAAGKCKNCYLVFSTSTSEDCYYGSFVNHSRNSIDNLNLQKSELCYECVHCENCYRCFFSQNSKNCSESVFLKNCIGCQNCFMSVNLVRKQYYILNKPYTKEEYFKQIQQFNLGSRKVIRELQEKFKQICDQSVVKYYIGSMNENSTGNYLYNTKNAKNCFELSNVEDGTYCNNLNFAKNVMDYSYWGENAELMYECQACGYDVYNLKFCNLCAINASNLQYCDNIFGLNECFGCVGMKNGSYCILNKQYTKSEYEDLVPRIIAHMKKTGEYGEFFPEVYSPFAYNESLAYETLPLTRGEVLKRGWQWLDRNEEYEYQGPRVFVSDDIRDVSNEITSQILTCASTGKQYKIIPQELEFYRKQNLPLPDRCPDQRHFDRLALRNPRKLYDRKCMKCQTEIKTTHAPTRPETVYCEKCYLGAVY